MAHGNVSYPHPVLGNGDDIGLGTTDTITVACTVRDESVTLEIEGLRTENPTIDKLVDDGVAEWVIRIQCARTYYRSTVTTQEPAASTTIDGRELDGAVDIDVSLCAIVEIPGYLPDGMHADYGDQAFDLLVGDLVVLGGGFRFNVDKEFDPLRASVRSLMTVSEGDHEIGAFRVDLDDDLILISLSKHDWAAWNATKDHAPEILHASLVVPVLLHCIPKVVDYLGTRWADRLDVLLERVAAGEAPLHDDLARAQALLAGPKARGPMGRGLASLQMLIDQGDF